MDPHAPATNDYALVNQGQLKWMAARAREELDANLRNGAGAGITEQVDGFSRSNLYEAANQGQVKNLARLFYERLVAEGCASNFPWTMNTADDDDFAAANVGQVKYVFAFTLDMDDNGLPDWWEAENADATSSIPATADADGDGLATGQEGARRTNPLKIDTDGDGIDDARDPAPTLAYDTDGDGLPDDWERFWFGSLSQTGDGDPEADGRTNAQEFRELTNPTQPDQTDPSDRAALDVYRPQR